MEANLTQLNEYVLFLYSWKIFPTARSLICCFEVTDVAKSMTSEGNSALYPRMLTDDRRYSEI